MGTLRFFEKIHLNLVPSHLFDHPTNQFKLKKILFQTCLKRVCQKFSFHRPNLKLGQGIFLIQIYYTEIVII